MKASPRAVVDEAVYTVPAFIVKAMLLFGATGTAGAGVPVGAVVPAGVGVFVLYLIHISEPTRRS